MWENLRIFHEILSVPHNIIMDLNNVMTNPTNTPFCIHMQIVFQKSIKGKIYK